MSVNIYLTPAVAQLDGFKIVGPGMATIDNIKIFARDESWYVTSSLDAKIPERLTEVVEKISLYESFPVYGGREMGWYEHKSASAEIDLVDNGTSKRQDLNHRVRLVAKSLEDARELIHLFRTGKIRPTESFEGPQGGKSRAELAQEADKAKEDVATLEQRLKGAEEASRNERAARELLVDRLKDLKAEIRARTWIVFMKKATLVEKLEQVHFGL